MTGCLQDSGSFNPAVFPQATSEVLQYLRRYERGSSADCVQHRTAWHAGSTNGSAASTCGAARTSGDGMGRSAESFFY
jgi:hypothetical protein